MERFETVDEILVDLGAASVETKGAPIGVQSDTLGGQRQFGLSND